MPLDDPEPDLNAVAAALGRLQPAPLASRDRILFRAGQESIRREARRRSSAWRALAAGLAAVAVGEATLLARRAPPAADSPIVARPEPSQPRPIEMFAQQPARAVAVAASAPPSSLGRPAARFERAWDAPPSADRSPTLPPLTGRELLRRELRSALLQGDRS